AVVRTGLAELRRVLSPHGRLVVTLDNGLNPVVALRNRLPLGILRRVGAVPYFVGVTCGPGGCALCSPRPASASRTRRWSCTALVLSPSARRASSTTDAARPVAPVSSAPRVGSSGSSARRAGASPATSSRRARCAETKAAGRSCRLRKDRDEQ